MPEIFPAVVYLLCFAASSACAFLLVRSYRRTAARLLLWSGICFVLLAANNLAVVVDVLVLPEFNFNLVRVLLSLFAVGALLFGLVWDLEERP